VQVPSPDQRLEFPSQQLNFNGYVNTELYNSDGKEVKWNLLQIGLKIGFHFLPCKSCGNDDYMRDKKRQYMEEMMKKQQEPIVVTNTVEYYYFVPTISQELLDEGDKDAAKKKALLDLAQALSKIKILFDLDKDIPKVEQIHIYHIDKAVELLKEYQDFKVVITGYTSPEGTEPHNQDLGHRRALAVRQIFINKGIFEDQNEVKNLTADNPQHKIDIPEKDWKEQRAVIFRIEKR
jgi:outer membrane protein OmpA-like peptidoglycan-associated protein